MRNKVNLIEQNGTSELTPRQEKAIAALLACSSVEAAARSVRIGRTTLYRWLKDEAFLAVYQEARRQARAWVPGRLQHLAGQAVYTLERIMDDPEASARARVTAARTVLELALRGREISLRKEERLYESNGNDTREGRRQAVLQSGGGST